MQWIRVMTILLFALLGQRLLLANDANLPRTAESKLHGKWLLETAELRQQDRLEQVWRSVVSITGDSFAISKFLAPNKELHGKIHVDPSGSNHLDVELEELDFSDLGEPVKIEVSTLKGVIQSESDDAITIAINTNPSQDRPAKFESTESVLLLRLRRAPKGFSDFPKEVMIQVESADGKPVAGAIVARFHSKRSRGKPVTVSRRYSEEKKTDSEGVIVCPYEEVPRLVVDEHSKQMAFPKLSPSSLVDGKTIVRLAPSCEVRGTIVCDELAEANEPLGWTNVYLEANGITVADCSSENGEFDFHVPAGEYTFEAYGGQTSRRRVRFAVQPNRSQATVDPIALKALGFVLLKGKPAPEFVGVVGWSGEPVRLADLRGKYVLIDFWGYWCGPCVEAMPILIDIHEKYSSKGLEIVGVHVDAKGEVDSAAKLSEKTSHLVKGLWQGKVLPFSNALVSGDNTGGDSESRKRGGTPGIYGIESFPTTILIDPQGNVVDKFPIHDLRHATEKIEKLLQQRD